MDPHDLLNESLRTTFAAGPPSHDERMVPSFLLPDSEGWLVSSEEMRAQGPYVITFFHGSWCGRCVDKLTLFEVPLVGYLLRPERTAERVGDLAIWLNRNGLRVMGALVALVGVSLVVQGFAAAC